MSDPLRWRNSSIEEKNSIIFHTLMNEYTKYLVRFSRSLMRPSSLIGAKQNITLVSSAKKAKI